MKNIALISQERAGILQLAPLCAVLKKNGVLEPQLVIPVRKGGGLQKEDLPAAFGIEDAVRTFPVKPASPVEDFAFLMLDIGKILAETSPVFVVPGGYGTAALAAALAAIRLGIPVVSIDAGLRSYDRSEPEEVNRIVIDSVAALHFVSEHSGVYNLMNEGVPDEQILFAGNTAIDSLVELIGRSSASGILQSLKVEPKKYVTVLLGLPVQNGTRTQLDLISRVLDSIAVTAAVLFMYPSGMKQALKHSELQRAFGSIRGVRMVEMPGYTDMLGILKESALVLTDREEFQAELTVMNVPCLTMRQSGARPSTIEVGTNVLVGFDEQTILEQASVILSGKPRSRTLIPEKWDGASSGRIAAVLEKIR